MGSPVCAVWERGDVTESEEASINNLRAKECKACTYQFYNASHSTNQNASPETKLELCNSFDEISTQMSSVLLGRQFDSFKNGVRGRRKVVSVTLKLGAGPSGAVKNKWAVVVCRRGEWSSRSFQLVKRTEISIDASLLMQEQKVELENPLVVEHGDYIGLCNPYGTLGLCTHSTTCLSKELTLYSSTAWESEGDALTMTTFSASSDQSGRTFAGFCFELSPIDLEWSSVLVGTRVESLLSDEKGVWLYDIAKEHTTLADDKKSGDADAGEQSHFPKWNDNKVNSVGSYCELLDSGDWAIGYALNGYNIGHCFNSIPMTTETLVPLILLTNVHGNEGIGENTGSSNLESVGTPPQEGRDQIPPVIVTSPSYVTPPKNTDNSSTSGAGAVISPTTPAITTPPKVAVAPLRYSKQSNNDENTSVTLCPKESMKETLKVSLEKSTSTCSDFIGFQKGSFLLTQSIPGSCRKPKELNDVAVEVILRPTLGYIQDLSGEESKGIQGADIFLYQKHLEFGTTMAILEDGRIFCYLHGSCEFVITSEYRIRSPTWHHISMLCQLGRINLFVDGVHVSTTVQKKWTGAELWNMSFTNKPYAALAVGSIPNSKNTRTQGWTGDVADVRVNISQTNVQFAESIGRSKILEKKRRSTS